MRFARPRPIAATGCCDREKKTPGVGDYGKYGLADAKGKPVLGIGDKGLTATATEIEAYLRGGEAATWRRSADLPSSAPRRKPAAGKKVEDPEASASPRRRRTPEPRKEKAKAKRTARPRDAKPAKPTPELAIRMARPEDMPAIARLVAEIPGSGSRNAIADRVTGFAEEHSGFIVAERGKLIGCLAWILVPALHRPPAARIATLIVTESERRQGIGRSLVEAAATALAGAGAASIEAMSDIAIRSAHGFFRRTGFEETAYRFARPTQKQRKPKAV